MDVLNDATLLILATPVYIIAIAGELIFSNLCSKKVYSVKGVFENTYLSTLNILFDLTVRAGVFVVLDLAFDFKLLTWETGILYWIILFIAEDFMYYWLHRMDHQCRLFWAVHVTHHSSEEFNLTVGFRSSVFQPLYRFVYFIPLALLGFNVMDIFFMYSITQLYGILVHTQFVKRLGVLEYILVTPSHHRVHHACNTQYLDRNMGMVLIIWDKLFGTFTTETETARYGLTKPVHYSNWWSIVTHEWKCMFEDVSQAKSWSVKLKYIFGPPGWQDESKDSVLPKRNLK